MSRRPRMRGSTCVIEQNSYSARFSRLLFTALITAYGTLFFHGERYDD